MTCQSANLMEDMDRQIQKPGAICLLYGVNGIGKTRLLQEFIDNRLLNQRKLMVRLTAEGNCEIGQIDAQRFPQQAFSKQLLQNLESDSTLVIDQFEYALPNVQLQLFQFWNKVSTTRDLKLIICGTHQVVTNLARVSSLSQLNINSVELKPLDQTERVEYIASKFCPDSRSYPEISSGLKKLIKYSGGLFTQIDMLSQQHADQIKCKDKPLLNKYKFPRISGSQLLLTGLLIGVMFLTQYYYIGQTEPGYKNGQVNLSSQPSKRLSSIDAKIDTVKTGQQGRQKVIAVDQTDLSTDLANDSVNTAKVETRAFKETENQHDANIRDQESMMHDLKDSLDHSAKSVLQQRILATQHWLARADDPTASIQIMTLGLNSNPEKALSLYLGRLKLDGINLDNIFIYSAPKKRSQLYGVLFGRYPGTADAIRSISSLPTSLKANKPIPRTVKGIKAEIKKNAML